MAKKKETSSKSSTKAAKPGEKKTSPSIVSRFTWHELVAIPLVALGLAVYWFRATLLGWYFDAQNTVLYTLGLGLIPLTVWVLVFVWALTSRRTWFRYYRLWAGSVALLAITFGALSFFRPFDGVLGWFALYGNMSLGGYVGEAIAGPVAWQAVLRLVGIAVLGFAIVVPVLAWDIALTLGRLLLYVYVAFILLLKSVARMYRRDKDALAPSRVGQSDDSREARQTIEYPSAQTLVTPGVLVNGGSSEFRSRYSDMRGSITETTPSSLEETYEDRPAWQPENYMQNGQVNEVYDDNDMMIDDDEEMAYEEPLYKIAAEERDSSTIEQFRLTDDEGEEDEYDADYELDDDFESLGDEEAEELQSKFNKFWDGAPVSQGTNRANGHDGGRKAIAVSVLGNEKREWPRPSIDMLEDVPDQGISEVQIRQTADTIKRTLADYGIEVEVGQVRPGPTVTMYGLIPGWVRRYKQVKKTDENGQPILDEKGKQIVARVEQKTRVKVDSILSREKDLALALKTPSIRIETPVMGKSQVGIEVPNSAPSPVTLRSVMESEEFKKLRARAHLPVAFGKGSGGETVVIDLSKMPHLLIAGATGSGKSVCLNTIVSCLIMEKSPSELRLLLIDPKRVELTPYNGIPHLLTPVVVEVNQVIGLLKGVIKEMMDRYRRMEEVGVRNIEAYNKRFSEEKMPFMVVVVDELADLMMTAAFDVEQSLCRLAQLGRATGIHLIVATQRPSVDVVTGLIKANFPSRVSFGVTSYIDSRTILDTTGAEKLLGRGDMLYLPLDASRPERIQGVFISDREIENLVKFWQLAPRGWMHHISLRPPVDEGDGEYDDMGSDSGDALFDKAVELAHTHSKLSTSLLQRRLRIGYPRAARLMDELEEKGIVGPSDGSKSRDVIMNKI
jgi:hypothetical protein